MRKYISLLRGINVGGQRKLRMETLRQIYGEAGLTNVRTYLQSGNAIFETSESEPSTLQRDIEERIEQTCGYHVNVFIWLPGEFGQVLQENPFLMGRDEETSKLHVTFLYQAPRAEAWEKLSAPAGIQDEFAAGKQAIYLYCPNGYGKTKLSNTFFERKLGVLATTRNWNSVQALYRLALEADAKII